MRLTVNQVSSEYGGSNPSLPTKKLKKYIRKINFLIYICITKNRIKMKAVNNISIIGNGAIAGGRLIMLIG